MRGSQILGRCFGAALLLIVAVDAAGCGSGPARMSVPVYRSVLARILGNVRTSGEDYALAQIRIQQGDLPAAQRQLQDATHAFARARDQATPLTPPSKYEPSQASLLARLNEMLRGARRFDTAVTVLNPRTNTHEATVAQRLVADGLVRVMRALTVVGVAPTTST